MGKRIDYLDDPEAPKPTSIVPSANALVLNDQGEILLIQRTDNGNWSLPGGAMDFGESLGQTAIRETLEETGVQIEISGVSGIYTNPRHVVHYTSDDEVRQEFSVVFVGRPITGAPTPSEESAKVEWKSSDQIDVLTMHASMRRRIADYLHSQGQVHWD